MLRVRFLRKALAAGPVPAHEKSPAAAGLFQLGAVVWKLIRFEVLLAYLLQEVGGHDLLYCSELFLGKREMGVAEIHALVARIPT